MMPQIMAIKSRFIGSSFPVLELGGCGRGSDGGPLKTGQLYGAFSRLATAGILTAQWIRSASVMPEASPLRPISHWRSGTPAMIALVLKSQPFRQLHGLTAIGKGET